MPELEEAVDTSLEKLSKVFKQKKQCPMNLTAMKASVTAALPGFVANFETSLQNTFATSFESTNYSHKEVEIRVDLHKPSYIYQVIGEFEISNGKTLSVGGVYKQFDYNPNCPSRLIQSRA